MVCASEAKLLFDFKEMVAWPSPTSLPSKLIERKSNKFVNNYKNVSLLLRLVTAMI